MKRFILSVVLVLSSFILVAEGKEVFSPYGEGFMANVLLPQYWAVDMNVAHEYGANGFFYLEDYDSLQSPAVIFLELVEKPDEKADLKEFIDYDQHSLKNAFPKMVCKDLKLTKKQDSSYEYKVFEFHDKPNGRLQYIAYLDSNSKYLIKLYIDFPKQNNVKKYRKDFLEAVYDLSVFTNVKLK